MRPERPQRPAADRVRLADGFEVDVRPLASTDAAALADFYARVPACDFHFYCPHPLTVREAAATAARAVDPRFVCLVLASRAGAIVGYAWVAWHDDADRASSLGICVLPDRQGTGAGRALLSRLLELAAGVGPPITSLTVQKANERALRLYETMGFEPVREQLRPSDGEPEFYMERRLR